MQAKMIAEKNDHMRREMTGCRIVFTAGVRELPQDKFQLLLELVRLYKSFDNDNDPHQEHDFGKIELGEDSYFWKFDYYDDKYEGFLIDGNRVLTIMRADEY